MFPQLAITLISKYFNITYFQIQTGPCYQITVSIKQFNGLPTIGSVVKLFKV